MQVGDLIRHKGHKQRGIVVRMYTCANTDAPMCTVAWSNNGMSIQYSQSAFALEVISESR